MLCDGMVCHLSHTHKAFELYPKSPRKNTNSIPMSRNHKMHVNRNNLSAPVTDLIAVRGVVKLNVKNKFLGVDT